MKRLGLLRHAKSDQDDLSLRDFDRGLNARGRRGAALMGRHIRDFGQPWDVIVASPAVRVKMTLAASGLDLPTEFQSAAYLASADTLLDIIHAVPADPAAVLLAAHNPGLQDLLFELAMPDDASDLLGAAAEKYPTAAFAVLELAVDRWEDVARGCGTLVHFARPRDLDPALGPES